MLRLVAREQLGEGRVRLVWADEHGRREVAILREEYALDEQVVEAVRRALEEGRRMDWHDLRGPGRG